MGGPADSKMRSLDSLKALDSLSDLTSQLEEARRLCNHSARAEMILRWLLGKLKASSEARQSASSWTLLASCVRLLSAQRIAAILGSGNFLDIVHTTTTEPELSIETIQAISSLWELLHTQGQRSDGVAILSLLSLKNTLAAAVSGDWMRHLQMHCERSATFAEILGNHSYLDLALQIWDLRKRQASDNELFNSFCLLPASILLTFLHSIGESTLDRKRKHGEDFTLSSHSYVHSLESVISKHTILPTRSTFFSKNEKATRHHQRHKGTESGLELEDALNSVGQTLIREQSSLALKAVPVLFDVALRAVPTPTPRHRIQERPWIEKVFDTLRSLITRNDEPDIRSIAAMIRYLRQRGASLAPKSLSQLVGDCIVRIPESNSAARQAERTLVIEIMALDPSIFATRSLAEQILGIISMFEEVRDRESWKADILLPMMRAFAQNRDLSTFIELWHQCLLKENRSDERTSLWTGLVLPIGDVLRTQTSEQILTYFDRYSKNVVEAELFSLSNATKLQADFAALEAVIRGIQNDDLLDRAWKKLDTFQQTIFNNNSLDEKAPANFYSALWQLLIAVFESWFPSAIENQRDHSAVATLGISLLGSEVFKAALRQCKKVSGSTGSAQMFVACLGSRFCLYDGHSECRKLCRISVEALCKQPSSALLAFTEYPSLLNLTDDESLAKLLGLAIKQSNDDLQVKLLDAIFSRGLPSFLDTAIAALETKSKQKKKNDKKLEHFTSSAEQSILQLIPVLKVHTLDSKKRGDVLNVLFRLPWPKTSDDLELLEKRFAIILKLLEYPCEGSDLLTDPMVLWNLIDLFDLADADRLAALGPVSLLSKVAEAVMRSWMKASTQNRDKLFEMSKQADRTLQRCLANPNNREAVALLGGAVTGVLETNSICLSEDFAHRRYGALQVFWKLLVDGGVTQDSAIFILEGLLAIPYSAFMGRPSGLESTLQAGNISRNAIEAYVSAPSPLRGAVSARAIRLYYRYATADANDLIQMSETVLKQDLSAPDHIAVLAAFEACLVSATPHLRSGVVQEYLKDGLPLSSSALALQQRALKAVTKEDFEASSGTSDFEVLHHVLQQAVSGSDVHKRQLSLQTIKLILKEKSFMVNQFGIEQTISKLHSILTGKESSSAIYLDVCQIVTLLLTQYTGRLQGRYHLMVALFQQLITTLFQTPNSSTDLHRRQSRSLARLLETFCNPPHVRKRNNLIDESRKAKAYAGQYAQYILHHYCSQILSNPPSDTEVREALLPGIWAIIEAIEINNNSEGIRSLSAAMNHSERAVLRSVYEEWQRRAKWECT